MRSTLGLALRKRGFSLCGEVNDFEGVMGWLGKLKSLFSRSSVLRGAARAAQDRVTNRDNEDERIELAISYLSRSNPGCGCTSDDSTCRRERFSISGTTTMARFDFATRNPCHAGTGRHDAGREDQPRARPCSL